MDFIRLNSDLLWLDYNYFSCNSNRKTLVLLQNEDGPNRYLISYHRKTALFFKWCQTVLKTDSNGSRSQRSSKRKQVASEVENSVGRGGSTSWTPQLWGTNGLRLSNRPSSPCRTKSAINGLKSRRFCLEGPTMPSKTTSIPLWDVSWPKLTSTWLNRNQEDNSKLSGSLKLTTSANWWQ